MGDYIDISEVNKEDLIDAIKTKYSIIQGYEIDSFFENLDL